MDNNYWQIDMSYEPHPENAPPELSSSQKEGIERKLKLLFPAPFKLWNMVFVLCANNTPAITIDHLLPGAEEEDIEALDRISYHSAKRIGLTSFVCNV